MFLFVIAQSRYLATMPGQRKIRMYHCLPKVNCNLCGRVHDSIATRFKTRRVLIFTYLPVFMFFFGGGAFVVVEQDIKYFYDITDRGNFKVNPDYKGVCHVALAQEGHTRPGEVKFAVCLHHHPLQQDGICSALAWASTSL